MSKWIGAAVIAVALALGSVACEEAEGPLCCVEINPGEGLRALTCEDDIAVLECLNYNFSDCYYDPARDNEC